MAEAVAAVAAVAAAAVAASTRPANQRAPRRAGQGEESEVPSAKFTRARNTEESAIGVRVKHE